MVFFGIHHTRQGYDSLSNEQLSAARRANGPQIVAILLFFISTALFTDAPRAFAQCGAPETGDCCSATGSPNCSDEQCCEAICSVDPLCCEFEWDEICADQAVELCSACGGSCGADDSEDCCEPNGTPGCGQASCCVSVCQIISACCVGEWDEFCAEFAGSFCSETCCPADFDGDGQVRVPDLIHLLGSWGACVGCQADFNSDGQVNTADLLVLILDEWGLCP